MSCHAEFLRVAAEDPVLAREVVHDFRAARLPAREVALLELVETVTVAPFEIDASTWDRLRGHGWSDLEIARAALCSAHFNYLNRMADGLGIRLDYPVSLEPQDSAATTHIASRLAKPRARPTTGGFLAADPGVTDELIAGLTEEDAPELWRALAFLPACARLVREWRTYHLTGTPALPDALRARIAVYGAGLAHCAASVRWGTVRAARLGLGAAALEALASGELDSSNVREAAVFAQVRRLTTEPWMAREQHVVGLRELGFSDRDVVQLTMLVSYLSFEHRAALALGIGA